MSMKIKSIQNGSKNQQQRCRQKHNISTMLAQTMLFISINAYEFFTTHQNSFLIVMQRQQRRSSQAHSKSGKPTKLAPLQVKKGKREMTETHYRQSKSLINVQQILKTQGRATKQYPMSKQPRSEGYQMNYRERSIDFLGSQQNYEEEQRQRRKQQRKLNERKEQLQEAKDNLKQVQEEYKKAQKKLEQAETQYKKAVNQLEQGSKKMPHNHLDDLNKILQQSAHHQKFCQSRWYICDKKVQIAWEDLRAVEEKYFKQIKTLGDRLSRWKAREHAKEIRLQRIKGTQRQLQQVENQLEELYGKLDINEERIRKAESQDKQTIAKWQEEHGRHQRRRKQLEETRQKLRIQLKKLNQQRL